MHVPLKPRKATPTTTTEVRTLPSHLQQPEAGNHVNHGEEGAGHEGSGADPAQVTAAAADEAAVTPDATSTPVQTGSGNPHTHSRSHSTADLFITPTTSPNLTPPPSPRSNVVKRIGERVSAEKADVGRKHETFFSSLSYKFQDVELGDGEGIPTEQFLECCRAVLPFFGQSMSGAGQW